MTSHLLAEIVNAGEEDRDIYDFVSVTEEQLKIFNITLLSEGHLYFTSWDGFEVKKGETPNFNIVAQKDFEFVAYWSDTEGDWRNHNEETYPGVQSEKFEISTTAFKYV